MSMRIFPISSWVRSFMMGCFLFGVLGLPMGVNPVYADSLLQGEINDVFDLFINANTSSSAGYFEGQARNYLSGGSFQGRNPIKKLEFFSINPPHVKAGCGGIDLFLGSFSFIDGDQFQGMLRSIAQNAAGYAFSLAIESLCPTCNTVVKYLQGEMNKLTKGLTDSCELGKLAVDATGLTEKMRDVAQSNCESQSALLGMVSDNLAAKTKCADPEDDTLKTAATQNDAAGKPVMKIYRNVTWEILKTASFLNDNQRELFMSVTGTLVVTYDEGSASQLKVTPYPPKITLEKFVDGTNADDEVYSCDENNNCMNPARIAANTSDGFNALVYEYLMAIVAKISGKVNALSNDEKAFVGLIRGDIYQILKLASVPAFNASIVRPFIDQSSKFIAYQLAASYIFDVVHTLRGGAGLADVNYPDMKSFVADLGGMKADVQRKLAETADTLNASVAINENHARAYMSASAALEERNRHRQSPSGASSKK